MPSNNMSIDINYDDLMKNLNKLKTRLKPGLEIVTETLAKKMEMWAQYNAKWTDRTGNARQTLTGRSYWADANVIVAEMTHGVEYGIWLELANNRKYAILEDAIEAHKDELMEAWGKVINLK